MLGVTLYSATISELYSMYDTPSTGENDECCFGPPKFKITKKMYINKMAQTI